MAVPASLPPHRIKAFTLLEISVVLVIISVVLGGGIILLTATIQQSQYNATVAVMQAIDDALLKYRIANNRLPCPGDMTIASGDTTTGTYYNITRGADYGYEAGTDSKSAIAAATGVCAGTNMTPAANFSTTYGYGVQTAAEGAVPVRTLRLPDSYMYDAWGNHIRYAVDATATMANAFTNYPHRSLNACGPITVNGSGGYVRSNAAMYALVSHGANGAGAYLQSGNASAISPANTDEQTNCHYVSGSCNGTYTPTYVQEIQGSTFDDIVSFKERGQLLSASDSNPSPPSPNGVGLVAGSLTKMYSYNQTGTSFSSLNLFPNNPGTLGLYNMVFFPDNNILFTAGTNGSGGAAAIDGFAVAGGTINYSWYVSDILNVAITPDGRLLTMIEATNHWLDAYTSKFYRLIENYPSAPYYFQQLATPYQTGPYYTQAYSPDGKLLALGNQATSITIQSVNCTTLTTLSTITAPSGTTAINSLSFSKDSMFLAVAATVSGAAEILIYQNNGAGTFTNIKTYTPGGTSAPAVAFSHNGNTLAAITAGTGGYPYLFFYSTSNGAFTAFSPVTIAAASTPNITGPTSIAWSRDDQFVAIGNGSTDKGDSSACGSGYGWCGIALYQVIGTTVNPMGALSSPPNDSITAVLFPN